MDEFKRIEFFIMKKASNDSTTEEAAIVGIRKELEAKVFDAK